MPLSLSSVNGSMSLVSNLLESSGISGQALKFSPSQAATFAFQNGSGADQSNKFVPFSGSVTSGSPVDHDLNGGALIDYVTGTAVSFTRLSLVWIINLSTATYISVGGGSNPVADFTNAIKVRPSTSVNYGQMCMSAPDATGIAVVAATGDILRITANSGTASYLMLLWGS
jgi:hypothetical protein